MQEPMEQFKMPILKKLSGEWTSRGWNSGKSLLKKATVEVMLSGEDTEDIRQPSCSVSFFCSRKIGIVEIFT